MHVLLAGRAQRLTRTASLHTIMHLGLPSALMLAQRCSVSTCIADQHCMSMTRAVHHQHLCMLVLLVGFNTACVTRAVRTHLCMHVLLAGRAQRLTRTASLHTIMHLGLPSALMLAQRCSVSTCTADQHCMNPTSSTSMHKCWWTALVTATSACAASWVQHCLCD